MEYVEDGPFTGFQKKKDHLVCIDSDGCAMDTMDIKHFRCFGPCMVKEWALENREREVLDLWNKVNLYSMTRGTNRFKALALVLETVDHLYLEIPKLSDLTAWAGETDELSNSALERQVRSSGSICLKKALHWSETVNREIKQLPRTDMLPFPGVREGIALIHQYADIAIVSSANQDAVKEEWGRHGLLEYVDILLAQNAGSKSSCIRKLLEYGYKREHVMMVGDAPGDRLAAEENRIHFYPILVAHEYESWRGIADAVKRLAKDDFTDLWQGQLTDEFEKNLQA